MSKSFFFCLPVFLILGGPAWADCGFLTLPMTQEDDDGVTRLNVWPEDTLLCFNGRKLICSQGGVWRERGTGICDTQEVAERDAAVLEGTKSAVQNPAQSPLDSLPQLTQEDIERAGNEACISMMLASDFCDAFYKGNRAGCEAYIRTEGCSK